VWGGGELSIRVLVEKVTIHEDVVWLFEWMSIVLSVVENSFKSKDTPREKLAKQVEKAFQMGELMGDV
jgi:hypothetical protein